MDAASLMPSGELRSMPPLFSFCVVAALALFGEQRPGVLLEELEHEGK
jgi:hypothetical protein